MTVLTKADFGPAFLEEEWVIAVQTPAAGLDALLKALRTHINPVQGHYDNCAFITAAGEQQFRALEGSYAGAENTIQATKTLEVQISIKPDLKALEKAVDVIYKHHVQEEPTIRIITAWGVRSKYTADTNNPNKYWNLENADEIHGVAVKQTSGGENE